MENIKTFTHGKHTLEFYKEEGDEKYRFRFKDNESLTRWILENTKTHRIREDKLGFAVKGIFDKLKEYKEDWDWYSKHNYFFFKPKNGNSPVLENYHKYLDIEVPLLLIRYDDNIVNRRTRKFRYIKNNNLVKSTIEAPELGANNNNDDFILLGIADVNFFDCNKEVETIDGDELYFNTQSLVPAPIELNQKFIFEGVMYELKNIISSKFVKDYPVGLKCLNLEKDSIEVINLDKYLTKAEIL